MISVNGVSMRYGSKVLFEDVTTTFSAGRRYGLTGPNGAGKSTFMKLLTGELPPQKGTVARPDEARRPPAGPVRLRPVPRDRHGDHGQPAPVERARGARAASTPRPSMTDDDGMRLGELEGIVGEEDGYTAESDAAILLQGLDIPDELHERTMSRAAGRPEGARAAGAGAVRPSAGAAARRADQPPRPRLDPLAARVPRRATTAR